MLLNGFAIDNVVINGTGGSVFLQALSLVSNTTSAVVRSTGKLLSALTTSALTLIKRISKTISIVESNTVVVVKSLSKLMTLVTSVSGSNLVKQVGHILSTSISNSVRVVKALGVIKSILVSNISSLVKAQFYFKFLNITSSIVSSLKPLFGKNLAVTINVLVTKASLLYHTFTVIVTSASLLAEFIVSFYRYSNERLFYVPSKLTKVVVTKARQVYYMANNRILHG